jgi:phospholipase D1/2
MASQESPRTSCVPGTVTNKINSLKEKLQETRLHDAKVELIHKKHQLGKFANLFNPGHRHDEEHEKACDDKRTGICESNRFKSFFPERDGNIVKWYVDGRDYFWAVSEALDKAEETIYIEDWYAFSPPHLPPPLAPCGQADMAYPAR